MLQTLRAVRAQEYHKLWGRTPGPLGATLWILSVAALRFELGVWVGALIMVALTLLSENVPSSWRVVEVLVDICYVTVMKSQTVRILWLLLIADLWIVQNMGARSVVLVLGLFVASIVGPFATRRLIQRPLRRLLCAA